MMNSCQIKTLWCVGEVIPFCVRSLFLSGCLSGALGQCHRMQIGKYLLMSLFQSTFGALSYSEGPKGMRSLPTLPPKPCSSQMNYFAI